MLGTRVVTALVLVVLLLAALLYLPYRANVLIFALATAIAAWEWATLLSAGHCMRRGFPFLVLAGCGLLYLVSELQPVIWLMSGFFWLFIAPIWLARGKAVPQGLAGYLIAAFLLLAAWSALGSLLQRGIELGIGPTLLLGCMSIVWVADTAAYFAGRLFGRHKLAPSISPGKTWEGVVGALLGVMFAGATIADKVALHLHIPEAVFFVCLILLTAVSIFGDLFESLLKRRAGVKDSSKLLPGHGGVLDRIDSLISALPVAALILSRSMT